MSGTLILYVDDDESNRIVFEASFHERFRIRCVASAEAALEVLAAEEVGVLVTDQRMPKMSGNQLLERAKQEYPGVIRIVITAYSDLDPILRAVNDGLVARYLVKPWTNEEVREMLRWAVGAYELGKESADAQLRLLTTERLATLGSVNSAILHDINGPISYITANHERLGHLAAAMPALTALLERHGAELDPHDRTFLAELAVELPDIAADGLDGCRVVTGITASFRSLLRGSPTGLQSTDVVRSVQLALSICRKLGERPQCQLAYRGPEELPLVALGSAELTQVLINLVSNAVQAITRKTPPVGKVSIDASAASASVRIDVTDDGPGMTPEVMQKVGRLFFTTRAEGTGIGLYQCRRLVEGAGGSLAVASTPGQGTTISVTLRRA